MKKIYAMMMAVLMIFASSCTNKKSDSTSAEDAALAPETETVSTASPDQETAGNDAIADQVDAEGKEVVMTQMISNGKPSVIDFSATWCGPCKMMKPIFHKLAAEFADKYNFITIDVDEVPALAEKYHIQAVPTFIFIDADGEEGDRIKGAVSEAELRDRLQNPAWF